jgi:YD repeat-containing protein
LPFNLKSGSPVVPFLSLLLMATVGAVGQIVLYKVAQRHRTSTDTAGQTTTYTYNAAGQVLTVVTPPRAELTIAQRTTTYANDTAGRLQSVIGPTAAAKTFTYDADERVRTATDSEGSRTRVSRSGPGSRASSTCG